MISHHARAKNPAMYAPRISTESSGTPVSSMIPLVSSLTWVSGRAYTAHDAASGSASTSNSVPHRNVMGTMTRDENMLSLCVLSVRIPASRPRRENVSPAASTTTSTSGSSDTSGDMMRPTAMRSEQLSRARITPARHFPRTIEDILTGHSRSSSKLM